MLTPFLLAVVGAVAEWLASVSIPTARLGVAVAIPTPQGVWGLAQQAWTNWPTSMLVVHRSRSYLAGFVDGDSKRARSSSTRKFAEV